MAGKTKKSDAKATSEARRSMSLLDQAQHTAHRKARDRRAEGRAARKAVPLASHAEFTPAAGRSDPVALLQSQDACESRVSCPSASAACPHRPSPTTVAPRS